MPSIPPPRVLSSLPARTAQKLRSDAPIRVEATGSRLLGTSAVECRSRAPLPTAAVRPKGAVGALSITSPAPARQASTTARITTAARRA